MCLWGQFALDFMLKLWQIFGPSTMHQRLMLMQQQLQHRLGRTHQKLSDSQRATPKTATAITTTRHLAKNATATNYVNYAFGCRMRLHKFPNCQPALLQAMQQQLRLQAVYLPLRPCVIIYFEVAFMVACGRSMPK